MDFSINSGITKVNVSAMVFDVTSDTATATRGRPRDEERTEAILQAAQDVLYDKGYDELRVNDIAEAAGCGLATIYRRWETKEELVAAALRCKTFPEMDETGDAAQDLRAMLTMMGTEFADTGESFVSLLGAARTHPIISDALSANVMTVFRPRFAAYLAAILGADDPEIEFLIDAIGGALMMRIVVLDNLVSPDSFADEVMAIISRLARG